MLCAVWFVTTVVWIFIDGFGKTMTSERGTGLIVAPLFALGSWIWVRFIVPKPVDRTVPSAAENTPLETPAVLTLRRLNSMMGALVPFTISLNGETACTLKNGECAEFTLTMKHNVLLIENVQGGNARLEFDAPTGGKGSVDMAGGAFKNKSLHWEG